MIKKSITILAGTTLLVGSLYANSEKMEMNHDMSKKKMEMNHEMPGKKMMKHVMPDGTVMEGVMHDTSKDEMQAVKKDMKMMNHSN